MTDPRVVLTSRMVLSGLTLAEPLKRVQVRPLRCDPRNGGQYRVTGTVAIDGTPGANTPVRRQVRLFSKQSGEIVRETWSDPVTGAYAFSYVAPLKYFVVAHDYSGFYDAVIHDAITPELMP